MPPAAPPSPTSCISRNTSSAGLVELEMPLPKSVASASSSPHEAASEKPTRVFPNWLLFCGVLAAGCSHAVLQEQLMKDMRGLPLLITSFEFGCCSLLSLLALIATGGDPSNAPRWTLLRISALVLTSLLSGNIALRWVAYPVKVVVKSCKLLPTMALGSLLLRKRYSRHDQVAALLLCSALVGFSFAGKGAKTSTGGAPSSPLGVAVLLFATCCDAVQVLLSERMLQGAPHLTPYHVMLYTNGFAFLAVLAGIIATDELGSEKAPAQIPWALLVTYGTCSWVGVCCFISLTRQCGATAAVVATNARKLLSVALSFVLFPKPFSMGFAVSGVAAIGGVYIHSRGKALKRKEAAEAKAKPLEESTRAKKRK